MFLQLENVGVIVYVVVRKLRSVDIIFLLVNFFLNQNSLHMHLLLYSPFYITLWSASNWGRFTISHVLVVLVDIVMATA